MQKSKKMAQKPREA